MTAQRPNVIVYQEYENITVAPDIPDLNVLVVGPCYQILDYADDKENCYAEDYGTLNSACPFVSPTAVVISSPPNALPGIELVASGVRILFDEGRAVMVEASTGVATEYAIFAANDNLFEAHTSTAGVHFGVAGVVAGDILITQSQGTDDYVMTVKEVPYVMNDVGGTLKFENGVSGSYDPIQVGDIVTISDDAATPSRNGSYTVTKVRDDSNLEFIGAGWEGNYGAGEASTISIVSSTGTVRLGYPVTGHAWADFADLRLTGDFALANDTTNRNWRVERTITDVELDSTDFAIVGNEITVGAALTTSVDPALAVKAISYAKIYIEYKALRTDLQVLTELSSTAELLETLGKYDSRNPLCVGATIASLNTPTTPISIYGVAADTPLGYSDFINKISSARDVYAIVPLTYDTTILATLNSMCESLADPSYVLTAGIKQKFRVTVGAIELVTEKYMVNASVDGTSGLTSAAIPAGLKTLTLAVGGTTPAMDLTALGMVPGDRLVITPIATGIPVVHTMAQLNAAAVMETDDAVAANVTPVVYDTDGDIISLTDSDGVVKSTWNGGAAYTLDNSVDSDTFTVTASALDKLSLILTAPAATFVTDGVIPGDFLQMPTDPNATTWTAYSTWVVDSVESQTRLTIVNSGNNTSELANELPHLYKRLDGAAVVQGSMTFRVLRAMSKAQQIDDMVAVATSFGSKRLLLCYPDSVDVSSLVDGSLTRSVATEPETAAAQPGYYLSCAVGGLTAGQPPQQGFTNMGIAGIDRIYNSSEYFTEEQLTELSNGGIYVHVQDTPAALPYSIHEVTTDVTALEFSEYMVVKDFDFIAWTYLDTLLPFLGEWNVIPSTIEFVRQALVSTGDGLKARFVAKIGAPLTNYEINSVDESVLSTDRIEAYVDVNLPMTLNTIGLHLVG